MDSNTKIRKKLKKFKIPKDKIIVFENADKAFHEHWSPTRSKLNIPHPFRACIVATPNCGKTNTIFNLILHHGCDSKKGENKPFEKVYIVHCSEHSREYDMVGAERLEEIPSPAFFDGKKKTLVILEDLAFDGLSRTFKTRVSRLFAFVSTHCSVSVCATLQDFYSAPPILKRCSNLMIVYPAMDQTSLASVSKKVGLHKDELKMLFKRYCKNNHDSIWIDASDNDKSPYKMRFNGINKIEMINIDT